jgi:mannose-6-phosphate isomerase-like protein (cupin superfamily)
VTLHNTAPVTRLTSIEDTDDVPAGMRVRLVDMVRSGRGVAPVEISHWTLDPGADSGDDRHSVRELWLVAAGAGEMTCGGCAMHLVAGDVVAIEPNQPHRLLNTGPNRVEVFSLWWAD